MIGFCDGSFFHEKRLETLIMSDCDCAISMNRQCSYATKQCQIENSGWKSVGGRKFGKSQIIIIWQIVSRAEENIKEKNHSLSLS